MSEEKLIAAILTAGILASRPHPPAQPDQAAVQLFHQLLRALRRAG